jgi:hypothetical protein
MNKLALLFAFSLNVICFSQKIIINVDEIQSFYGDTSQNMNEIFNNVSYTTQPESKNCTYVINTSDNTVDYYRDTVLYTTEPIEIEFVNNHMIVRILEYGFNVGLIINFNVESVVYYDIRPSYVEYMKFTKFEIVKSD